LTRRALRKPRHAVDTIAARKGLPDPLRASYAPFPPTRPVAAAQAFLPTFSLHPESLEHRSIRQDYATIRVTKDSSNIIILRKIY
jgi:hypothetical protein